MTTIFLLSPANCGGTRAQLLLKSRTSPLTARLAERGAPLGEVFTFMSSLYFRGKVAYATRFGVAYVIAPGRGLLPVDVLIRVDDLRRMADVPVDAQLPAFREPLIRDAATLLRGVGPDDHIVLLGSVASKKYVEPLLEVFGERLHFPATFVGRGDMSRGGLMLRCAQSGTPLEYVPVRGAVLHGKRPAKLSPIRRGKLGNGAGGEARRPPGAEQEIVEQR